jgi:hypothetical protein
MNPLRVGYKPQMTNVNTIFNNFVLHILELILY